MKVDDLNLKFNGIVYNDMANGRGTRVSLFTQGCPHHCKECFNPETWSFNGGKIFTQQDFDNIFFVLDVYGNYYDGISLLGGDPMHNLGLCNLVVDEFRRRYGNTKDIWIWSGDTYEEIIKNENQFNLLKKCDILVDGRFIEELKNTNIKFRGSSNQRIINIQESLKQNKIILDKDN